MNQDIYDARAILADAAAKANEEANVLMEEVEKLIRAASKESET